MDCEKAQSLLLDELYGELDEVTSAALKRHASGCTRCSADLESLRATRKAVSIPLDGPPADLEQRIMAAVKEAQKVIPLRSRLSTAVSRAGSWAMRPQTAMAALFLLMVGSTTFFLRGRYTNRAASAPMTVLEEGTPTPSPGRAGADTAAQALASAAPMGAPAVAMRPPPALDPSSDLEAKAKDGVLTGAAASAAATATTNAVTEGYGDKNDRDNLAQGRSAGALAFGRAEDTTNVYPRNAAAVGGASGSGYGGAPNGNAPSQQAQAASPFTSQEAKVERRDSDEFTTAMAAYRGGNYSEAVRRFDAAAGKGDPTATLWAARSVRASAGCGAAAPRFEAAATRLSGPNAFDAALEAGQCRAESGDTEAARASLVPLLNVPSHRARAESTLSSLAQIASKKSGGGSAGAVAAPKPAPARAASKVAAEAPASPPAAKAADKSSAY